MVPQRSPAIPSPVLAYDLCTGRTATRLAQQTYTGARWSLELEERYACNSPPSYLLCVAVLTGSSHHVCGFLTGQPAALRLSPMFASIDSTCMAVGCCPDASKSCCCCWCCCCPAGKDVDRVDNDYFLCACAILDHAGPLLTSFPVENRLLPQVGALGSLHCTVTVAAGRLALTGMTCNM